MNMKILSIAIIKFLISKLHKSKELNEIIENRNSEYVNIAKNLQI